MKITEQGLVVFSLENLASSTEPILIDTCVLNHYDGEKENYKSLEEKRLHYAEALKALRHFVEQIKQGGNFYFTPKVLAEVENPKYNYKKNLKRSVREGDSGKLLLGIRRAIRERKKMCNRLVYMAQDLGRVFTFQDEQERIFDALGRRHMAVAEYYGLSEADYEFLISGVTLAEIGRMPVGLTNDKAIYDTWKVVMEKQGLWREKFQLLRRRNMDEFFDPTSN